MGDRLPPWVANVRRFIQRLRGNGHSAAPSIVGGPATLYGTCYALLTAYYLGDCTGPAAPIVRFISGCQDRETGLMIGPELRNFKAAPSVLHDREHLLLHLTCTAVPTCQQFGMKLPFPIRSAHRFCDRTYLRMWLDNRCLEHAWYEGNNILFVGQLLVYLRDVENHSAAQPALDCWFRWLDEHADPKTGLWGTDGHCSAMEAVYGGYHQLLVYYHENHPIRNPHGLVDAVLGLQHTDGSFHPDGNGGACEDADCVDILVNRYKQNDYRRAEIRCALRRCLRHILALQNPDGGFPYNRDCPQSHMGIPGTEAAPNQSTMFATWFRVHTLALMAEIMTDEPKLEFPFRFTNKLSAGWHQTWDKAQHPLTTRDRGAEIEFERNWQRRRTSSLIRRQYAPVAKVISRARTAVGRLRLHVVGK
jgi:hypothetical protein